MIEANEFPALSQRYNVMSVPKTVINGTHEFVGALPEARVVQAIQQALGSGEAAADG